MIDYNTVQDIKKLINKRLTLMKDELCYGIDTLDKLHYARGQLRALETLLQDLNDLLKRENSEDDDNSNN
jgi:hypothetical protein